MTTQKRTVPCWDEYFMKIAETAKTKSKDRSTQVAAVIVGEGHIPLSVGYNGFPRDVNDDVDVRHERPLKYLFTEHAERNAIYAAARHGVRLSGSTIYVTGGGTPCADCSRAIIQAGIIEVVGMDRKFEGAGALWEESCKIGREMLLEAGVRIVLLNEKYEVSTPTPPKCENAPTTN